MNEEQNKYAIDLVERFRDCREVVDHVLDTKGLNEEETLNFHVNMLLSKVMEIGMPKKPFVKLMQIAYDICSMQRNAEQEEQEEDDS